MPDERLGPLGILKKHEIKTKGCLLKKNRQESKQCDSSKRENKIHANNKIKWHGRGVDLVLCLKQKDSSLRGALLNFFHVNSRKKTKLRQHMEVTHGACTLPSTHGSMPKKKMIKTNPFKMRKADLNPWSPNQSLTQPLSQI